MSLFSRQNHRQQLLASLQKNYCAQVLLAKQIKTQAETARYRCFKDGLLALANAETKQAEIIQELLKNLGVTVPKEIPACHVEQSQNLFQALSRDLELERENFWQYHEQLHEAEAADIGGLIQTLNQLREQELEHRKTLFYLLQRMNPYQI